MISCRAGFSALLMLSLITVTACTSSSEVKEAVRPEEPEAIMEEPVPSAPADMGDAEDEFSNEASDAEMDASEEGGEAEMPAAGDQSGGKGGIISSGVKKKKKPCMSITNPRQRQRCLDRLKQKP